VAVVIALVALVPKISAGAGVPAVPTLDTKTILAKAQKPDVQGLTGTIQLTSNLGIPDLSSIAGATGRGGFDPTTFLAGTHKADVAASSTGFKATYPGSLSEDWVIANRQEIWTWQSQGQKITHATLPPKTPEAPGTAQSNEQASGVKTPDQVAQDLLNKLQPTTAVTQLAPTTVAGQSAYQLQLTPKDPSPKEPTHSLVDHVTIAVDAAKYMPLQVEVFAKGASSPALSFGFSSVDYTVPPASTFSYTPPSSLKVTEKTISAHQAEPSTTPDPAAVPSSNGNKPVVLGQGWDTVAILNSASLPGQVKSVLQKGTLFLGGTLIHTTLFNVVVYDTGKVVVGAVDTQSPLWAQAAKLG
jgi:hypothetical protein